MDRGNLVGLCSCKESERTEHNRVEGGTQSFFAFLSCTFLAPLWRRLGLLLAKDNLAFFRGSADCGDLPDTPFWGSFF